MPEAPPEKPTLTFDWRQSRGQQARLAFWLFIAVLGLAAFFALFRVVYPQTQRFTPVAQQVTLLDENDPVARAVLNTVQDRDFLMLPAPDGKKSAVSLGDRAPVFHPSFEKHELKLHDLPQRASKPQPVRLLNVTEPLLPRPDLSDLRRDAPSKPPVPQKLVLRLQGALASRAIISQPDFTTLKMTDPESWRIHIGVDSQGRVIFSLPLEAPGKLDDAAPLLRLVRQVRFAPDAANSTAWGEAALLWTAAKP